MPARVLETVLTGKNLLSPVLAGAARDVTAFDQTVNGSNARVAASATASARTQSQAHRTAAQSATASSKAQQAANSALSRSNGLLGTSLTPLTAGLGVVALGLGYAAFKGMEFDSAMSRVQAATQAGAGDMDKLRQAAITLGADTQFSATEAAAGITELAKAGVSTADILNGGLKGALDLAAAGELSVADAAEIAATALTVFNLGGDQMSHVADLLAAGAGKAQGSVADLAAALNQSSLVARNTGLSIEDTAGALALFASNGLTGSDAGTSFKTMLQSLNPRSVEAANLMDQLGLNAYDAQGNFVGLSTYAEQLKTSLSGMSQEQRNAALQTIFGSDAVRAATVLYEAGSAGVDQWTGAVNDAGYAAKQAAQLNDNLRGDLEKLGGAVDSLFTSMGAGAQGPLRFLVQGLTGLVNVASDVLGFFSGLPGPVQAAVGAFAAWALVGAKITGLLGGMKGALGSARGVWRLLADDLSYARANGAGLGDTLKGLGSVAGGTAAEGFRRLAKAIGPELGIAAAVYVISDASTSLSTMANAGDAAAAEVKELDKSLGAIDGNAARIEATASAIDDLKEKLDAAREAADVGGADFTAALGNPLALGALTAGYDDAAASADVYRDAIAALEEKQAVVTDTAERLGNVMGLSGDQVVALADKYGIDLSEGLGAAYQGFQSAEGAADGLAAGADDASVAADVLTAQLQGVADAADAAKQQTDLLKTSLDALTGQDVSMIEATAQLEAALDAANGAMEGLDGSVRDSAGGLNLQSEAGRRASEILIGVKDSGNQLIATMIQQGATEHDVLAADAQLRAGFIRTAQQMGFSAAEANSLANQILGIPTERRTNIEADTADAQAGVATVQSVLNSLPLFRNITITTTYVTRGVAPALNGPAQYDYASGGWTGPGAKFEPAGVVHRDEFVVTKERVAALGGPRGVASRVGMPLRGYADGGPVAAADAPYLAPAALPGYRPAPGGWHGAMQVVERNPSLTYVDQRPGGGMSMPKLVDAWHEMEYLTGG